MDYKKMMGYSDKKKVTKKQSQPKKNQILENIKSELNEWNDTTFKDMPKRWSKNTFDTGLTEFEKKGGKDFVNETLPAYPKEWKNLEKACYDLEKAVKILGKSVEKQDRKKGKMIPNIYKTLEASIKKYKNLIQTEILSKLQ